MILLLFDLLFGCGGGSFAKSDADLGSIGSIYPTYCKFRNDRENFFSRIALKDTFATYKNPEWNMTYLYQ